MDTDIENLVATIEAGIRGKADYPYHLVGLAEFVAGKKLKLRAFEIARSALAAGRHDRRTAARAHDLLQTLVPRYHIPMMNDARRNAAWDKALRRAIRPGMLVLEIGTGAGMLAMMAARAGAEKVVTCEENPVVAALAREIVARNGYAGRIDVVSKPSRELVLGTDLERRADLLFCDNFADNLFHFDPLRSLADAWARLLAPNARILPAAVSLRLALADWRGFARAAHISEACGFDLAPMNDFALAARTVKLGDPDLALLSPAQEVFGFDLHQASHPAQGSREISCVAERSGEVNGVVRWIKLDLDETTHLETRPEPGAVYFSNPEFCPFEAPVAVRLGERLRVGSAYNGRSAYTWLAGRD